MGGVALAMTLRQGGEASLAGDLAALGAAWGWAATALLAKASPLSRVPPEGQLLWQVGVSAPILLILAPFFGPLLRDPTWVHWAGLAFQIVIVVSAGFIFWLWLLARYPASGVASLSFASFRRRAGVAAAGRDSRLEPCRGAGAGGGGVVCHQPAKRRLPGENRQLTAVRQKCHVSVSRR
jgi:drug/metabolite transporter (DMT)-like permease